MGLLKYLTPLRVLSKAGEGAGKVVEGLDAIAGSLTADEVKLFETGVEAVVEAVNNRTGEDTLKVVEVPAEEVAAHVEKIEKLAPIIEADPTDEVKVSETETVPVADLDLSNDAHVDAAIDALPESSVSDDSNGEGSDSEVEATSDDSEATEENESSSDAGNGDAAGESSTD